MDYLPWAGYWFYADTAEKRAARFGSYGLLDTAPEGAPSVVRRFTSWLGYFKARFTK